MGRTPWQPDAPPDAVAAPFAGAGTTDTGLAKHVPIYLPEIYPIPDATEFNPSGFFVTAASEIDEIPLLPFINANGTNKLPTNNVGIIRGFLVAITDMVITTDLSFSLLINGAPAGGYGTVTIARRDAAFASNSFDTFIRVPNGARISVIFNNVDGGAHTVSASVSGWYWPLRSGKRWIEKGY